MTSHNIHSIDIVAIEQDARRLRAEAIRSAGLRLRGWVKSLFGARAVSVRPAA